MRILGLIALYAVALFLMGWLLLQSTAFTNRQEQSSSFSFVDQTWSGSFPSDGEDDKFSADSTFHFPIWKLLPVGLVRYPDFGTFDFLKNGD